MRWCACILQNARPRPSLSLAITHQIVTLEIQEKSSAANRVGKREFAVRIERKTAGLQHSQNSSGAGGLEGRPGLAYPWAYLQSEGWAA